MFYQFFPHACLLCRRGRLLLIPLFLFVVLGLFARSHAFNHNPAWRQYAYLGGMDAIALGCLTALFVARYRLSRGVLWMVGCLGTALLVFSLAFSIWANQWGLGANGLSMSLLAVGTCMVIAEAAQTRWQAPRALRLILQLGQRSYEVYLTHVFVVLLLFRLFLAANKPMVAVPALFIAVILLAGLLGELIARDYQDPMNRWLRRRLGDGPMNLGSVIGGDELAEHEQIPNQG